VTLSLKSAHRLALAATKNSEEIGIPYAVTIVDGGGNVVHVGRMDGAASASIDTSLAKARTSVYFGAATADLAGAVQPGAPMYPIATSTVLPLAFVAGAVPVTDSAGVVIGAVGAGGGSPQQDHEVASSAVNAL
jgi:uncharacterized protein GlcG (DUF336 family)